MKKLILFLSAIVLISAVSVLTIVFVGRASNRTLAHASGDRIAVQTAFPDNNDSKLYPTENAIEPTIAPDNIDDNHNKSVELKHTAIADPEPQTVFPQRYYLSDVSSGEVFQFPEGSISAWSTFWEINIKVGDIIEIPVAQAGVGPDFPSDYHKYTYSGYDSGIISVSSIKDFDETLFGEEWISALEIYQIGLKYKDDPDLAKAKKEEALIGRKLYSSSETNFVITALSEGRTFVHIKGIYEPPQNIKDYDPCAQTGKYTVIDRVLIVKVAARDSEDFDSFDSFFDNETKTENGFATMRRSRVISYFDYYGKYLYSKDISDPDPLDNNYKDPEKCFRMIPETVWDNLTGWDCYYDLAESEGLIDHRAYFSSQSVTFNYYCDAGRISLNFNRNAAGKSWDEFVECVKKAVGGTSSQIDIDDSTWIFISSERYDYLLKETTEGFLSITLDKGVLDFIGADSLKVEKISLNISGPSAE